jgi:hypothetical protein
VQAARLVASYEGVPDDARVESMAGGLDKWERELATADEGDEENENRETERDEPDAPF